LKNPLSEYSIYRTGFVPAKVGNGKWQAKRKLEKRIESRNSVAVPSAVANCAAGRVPCIGSLGSAVSVSVIFVMKGSFPEPRRPVGNVIFSKVAGKMSDEIPRNFQK
jgi:hypothetical protein